MNAERKTYFLNPRLYSVICFAVICLGLLIYTLLNGMKDHTPEITFSGDSPTVSVSYLSVGEADCILIKTPSGKSVMIDTGYSNRQPDVLNYVESLGIFRLDCMILTHPHEDHVQLASGIFDYMPVERLMIPNTPTVTECLQIVLEKAKEKEIPVHPCKRGESFTLDGVEFLVLCDSSEVKNNDNASVVILMRYKERTFLFTGDAPIAQEEELLSTAYSVDADVLKVGHHGSDTSSGETFLKAVSPQIAVISVGYHNEFYHPKFEVVDRLQNVAEHVLRTDLNGTVMVVTDGRLLKVFSEK